MTASTSGPKTKPKKRLSSLRAEREIKALKACGVVYSEGPFEEGCDVCPACASP